jgi:acetyltransferase-like isoleucine patch superfamily enzyme
MEKSRLYQFVRYELGLWLVGLLTNWLPEVTLICRLRGALSRIFLKKCGRNFQYGARVRFLAPWGIEIGDNVYIAGGTWVSGSGGLILEDEVIIGPYCIIATGNHRFKNGSARFGSFSRSPVKIGRGSWVASHVVVVPGITIGKGNLVAAGAVVTESMEDNVIIGGVPAKLIGPRKDDVEDVENGDY